jgi:pimeloyl-ACP methyl ester carboxylesterase
MDRMDAPVMDTEPGDSADTKTFYVSRQKPEHAKPVAFDGLFGWLHAASGRRGVVICNPLGYTALFCQPAIRALAEAIASAGLPCLRFDYPSEGDSLGAPHDPDRVAAWIDSATRAIDQLDALCGVEEIALVGLEFGALAALEAATRRRERVQRIVLLAPPASGRALVRQMRADAAMVAADTQQQLETEDGGFFVAGFEYSRDTLDQIGRLTLKTEAAPERTLVLSPGEAPRGLGERAETQKFSGYAAMLGARALPHIPQKDWRHVADWLTQDAPAPKSPAPPPSAPATLAENGFVETALRFGADDDLAGVLCAPAQGESESCAILINTGANAHIGWARGGVLLSRRLAREGIAALRMDLRGLGESAALPGGAAAALYDLERTRDVREAVAFMKKRGYQKITLVGQCSGAHAALHTALRDADVSGLVLVNQLRFIWGANEKIEEAIAQPGRSSDAYLNMWRNGEGLRRLLRGEAPLTGVLRAARKIGKRGMLALGEAVSSLLKPPPKPDTPEAWLHQLAARGVAMHLLFSENDASLDEFARYFGRGDWRARRIAGLERAILKGADHSLSSQAARETVLDHARAAARSVVFLAS